MSVCTSGLSYLVPPSRNLSNFQAQRGCPLGEDAPTTQPDNEDDARVHVVTV